MRRMPFRFAAVIALIMVAATVLVAVTYNLPIRDPDGGVAGPTYLRLPVLLFAAVLTDVLPRAIGRARRPRDLRRTLPAVLAERWTREHVVFAVAGLGTWYLTYAAFRNLKSYVPFVNGRLYDEQLASLDRLLFLGHEPAAVLHSLLGTGVMAHLMSAVYIAWIVFVPTSLIVALVWSRNVAAGEWYVTAVAVDWVLGVATYFVIPSLGPVYAQPSLFSSLAETQVDHLQASMIAERAEVLGDPFATQAVQTIAAFASLHVGITVTACLIAHLLRLPRLFRWALWAFLVLTVTCTVYLGWHYALDAIGGAVLGTAAVWIAARGVGLSRDQLPRASAAASTQPDSLNALDNRSA